MNINYILFKLIRKLKRKKIKTIKSPQRLFKKERKFFIRRRNKTKWFVAKRKLWIKKNEKTLLKRKNWWFNRKVKDPGLHNKIEFVKKARRQLRKNWRRRRKWKISKNLKKLLKRVRTINYFRSLKKKKKTKFKYLDKIHQYKIRVWVKINKRKKYKLKKKYNMRLIKRLSFRKKRSIKKIIKSLKLKLHISRKLGKSLKWKIHISRKLYRLHYIKNSYKKLLKRKKYIKKLLLKLSKKKHKKTKINKRINLKLKNPQFKYIKKQQIIHNINNLIKQDLQQSNFKYINNALKIRRKIIKRLNIQHKRLRRRRKKQDFKYLTKNDSLNKYVNLWFNKIEPKQTNKKLEFIQRIWLAFYDLTKISAKKIKLIKVRRKKKLYIPNIWKHNQLKNKKGKEFWWVREWKERYQNTFKITCFRKVFSRYFNLQKRREKYLQNKKYYNLQTIKLRSKISNIKIRKMKKLLIKLSKKTRSMHKRHHWHELKLFKWKFITRKWSFAMSKYKNLTIFNILMRDAWDSFRKIKKNFLFIKLFKANFNHFMGINEQDLLNKWLKIRRGDNHNNNTSLFNRFNQMIQLKMDGMSMLLGLVPSRFIAQEFVRCGGMRINGNVITNTNYSMQLNDILQVDLQINKDLQNIYKRSHWESVKVRIKFVGFLQVLWPMMLFTMVRHPYNYELIEESILNERWIRFFVRYFPVRITKYQKPKIKWYKY